MLTVTDFTTVFRPLIATIGTVVDLSSASYEELRSEVAFSVSTLLDLPHSETTDISPSLQAKLSHLVQQMGTVSELTCGKVGETDTELKSVLCIGVMTVFDEWYAVFNRINVNEETRDQVPSAL